MVRAAAFKRKLNALTVQRAKPRTRAYLMWDTLARGLALRVQPTGRKSFCVIYRSHGRPRWLHLGDASVLPVARGMPRSLQMPRRIASANRGGRPNTKPLSSSPNVTRISCTATGNHTRCVAPFLVPGQWSFAAPGMVHHPSAICSRRMCATSPGLCPVSSNTCKAVPAIPNSSNACQNSLTSASLSTRSRLTAAWRSIPRAGLLVINS